VLKEVSGVLTSALNRSADMAVRYGGKEFILFLPETETDWAEAGAERARKAVEQQGIIHERNPVASHMTISVVRACVVPKGNEIERLLQTGDDHLYQAKEEGRNRVAQLPDFAGLSLHVPHPTGSLL
jgi:diguanylate cyclase (GGDEF)-like protein